MRQKVLKGKVSKNINVTVIFRGAEDGTVFAECTDIPGCSVEGFDEEDAKVKIQAAIEGCLTALLDDVSGALTGTRVMTAGRFPIN